MLFAPSVSVRGARLLTLVGLAAAFALRPVAAAPEARVSFPLSHIAPALAAAHPIGHYASIKPLSLTLVLPLRNRAILDAQIRRISDPKDALYGHYLTPEQFTEEFGPSQEDVEAVSSFAESHGLTVKDVSASRTLVHVTGPQSAVESAFGVRLNEFVASDGRHFFAPDREPTMTADVAGKLMSVLGLSNAQKAHAFSRMTPAIPLIQYYSGHAGLSPSDVRSIYSLSTTYTGTGQVAAVYEEGTFTPSDISTFFSYYTIPSIPVNPISVDGYSTSSAPGGAAAEVTLDIDMIAGLAPGVSQIRVYENTDQGTIGFSQQLTDTFTAMANETNHANRPSVISVSYGLSEDNFAASDFTSVDQATSQLASQGQGVCVSAGDAGAYTDQSVSTPNASFPTTDPYVTSVGGTDLTDNSSLQYVSETSWADPSDTGRGPIGTGGGGGISSYWGIPNYQVGSFTTSVNPQGSTTKRNVPDVSLYGDYDTGGYDIYFSDPSNGAGWYGYNGTSASSPLWAAFLADVDQARLSKNSTVLGFANPSIYSVAKGTDYGTDFHDIKDGSNNLYYNAVAGYDNSTGWGSFVGNRLLTDLSPNGGPATLSSLTFTPVNVVGGSGNSTGVVKLSGKATSTVTVTLTSSNPAALSVPATAVINSGYTSKTITATSHAVTTDTVVTITATYSGVTKTATVTVSPVGGIALSSLVATPTTVIGGSANPSVVAKLTGKATTTATIYLTSSNPSVLSVPATVTINTGYTSKTFTATSSAVTTATIVTLTATYDGVSKTATVTVNPAPQAYPQSLTFNPNPAVSGGTTVGTVTLTGPAPSGGAAVALSYQGSTFYTLNIAAGQTSASVTISYGTVTTQTTFPISATYNGTTITTNLVVNP